jgi:hypothetical protein
MVMASCPTCERRALFVVTFPDQAQPSSSPVSFEEPRLFPHTLLPLPNDATRTPDSSSDLPLASPRPARRLPTPISETDVFAMHEFLANFDGDFGALFTPGKRKRLDE